MNPATWNITTAGLPGWAFVLVVVSGLFVELWADNGPDPLHPLECAQVCYPSPVERFSQTECVCKADD